MTSLGDLNLRWIFYETAMGRAIVSEEIRKALTSKAARLALGELMDRIQNRRTFRRDVRNLGRELCEARLTFDGNEYRLYYAQVGGRAVLLGLLFHRKGGQGAQDRAIAQARERLADWGQRDIR